MLQCTLHRKPYLLVNSSYICCSLSTYIRKPHQDGIWGFMFNVPAYSHKLQIISKGGGSFEGDGQVSKVMKRPLLQSREKKEPYKQSNSNFIHWRGGLSHDKIPHGTHRAPGLPCTKQRKMWKILLCDEELMVLEVRRLRMRSRYILCLDHHMYHQHLCDGHLLMQFTFCFALLVLSVRSFDLPESWREKL